MTTPRAITIEVAYANSIGTPSTNTWMAYRRTTNENIAFFIDEERPFILKNTCSADYTSLEDCWPAVGESLKQEAHQAILNFDTMTMRNYAPQNNSETVIAKGSSGRIYEIQPIKKTLITDYHYLLTQTIQGIQKAHSPNINSPLP